jgi:hypothetical protein
VTLGFAICIHAMQYRLKGIHALEAHVLARVAPAIADYKRA